MRKKRILSEEHKRKISNANKGKHKEFSQEAIKNIRAAAAKRKGIKKGPRSEEIKKKISEATKGKKKILTVANKSWFPKGHKPICGFKKGRVSWNKGKQLGCGRNSSKYKEWKKQIFDKAGHKCVKCGSKEKLHAHHIIPWKQNKELRFDLSNGSVLCNSCHSKQETTLGIVGIEYRYKKGHILSESTRKKLSESLKGKPSWNKGKKQTKETIEKLRIAHIGLAPWNKGKRKQIELFKKCKVCGIEKSHDKFTPNQSWKSNTCKDCRNEKIRNNWALIKDKVNKKRREKRKMNGNITIV